MSYIYISISIAATSKCNHKYLQSVLSVKYTFLQPVSSIFDIVKVCPKLNWSSLQSASNTIEHRYNFFANAVGHLLTLSLLDALF